MCKSLCFKFQKPFLDTCFWISLCCFLKPKSIFCGGKLISWKKSITGLGLEGNHSWTMPKMLWTWGANTDCAYYILKGQCLKNWHSLGVFKPPSSMSMRCFGVDLGTPFTLHPFSLTFFLTPIKMAVSTLPWHHSCHMAVWDSISLSSWIMKFCRFWCWLPNMIFLFTHLLTGWDWEAGYFQRYHQGKLTDWDFVSILRE